MLGCKLITTLCLIALGMLNFPIINYFGNVDGFNGNPIFTNNDVWKNETFSEYSNQYWNWFHSLPPDIHLWENYNSQNCGLNQNYSAWFLADSPHMADNSEPTSRECTLSNDKPIFTQIVGSGCSYGEGITTHQGLIDCSDWVFTDPDRLVEFSVYLDGIPIIDTYSNSSDENYKKLFYVDKFSTNITIPQQNLFGDKPGEWPAMTGGYFLFLKPLSIGSHELSIREDVSGHDFEDNNSEKKSNLSYKITVQ